MAERAWACVRHYPRGAADIIVSTIRSTRQASIAMFMLGWDPDQPASRWRYHQRRGVRCERVTVELEAVSDA